MRSDIYQIALISLGIIATAFLGVFFYRELYPEYRIYQDDYIALENFRSTYTSEPPPSFQEGVKQIVFEREDKGPANIDRCVSCHVAEQLPHFSPTKIAYDINGNIVRSADGTPVQIPNENYVWLKLDQKIADLRDSKVNEQLAKQGQWAKLRDRESEAAQLETLKTAKVGEHVYDVTKVLSMHSLIGKETRPFEFHPLEEYGCTICHSGNGKGLTTEKAHGPVFDNQYEIEYMGPTPHFTEKDPKNDPEFSRVFNHKPGDALVFQTTPILVGNLIQSSCIQCHEQSSTALQGIADTASQLTSKKVKQYGFIQQGYEDAKEELIALLKLKHMLITEGFKGAVDSLNKSIANPAIQPKQQSQLNGNLAFLIKEKDQQKALDNINKQIVQMLGSPELVDALDKAIGPKSEPSSKVIDKFLEDQHRNPQAKGSLFVKREIVNLEEALLGHIHDAQSSFSSTVNDKNVVSAMTSDIDWLTKNYHRGQQLYLSQACYACHKIAGFARGGVGPELTREGEGYPWFVKEKIVWPQADLKTSTMPNYILDHIELEDLMTFLLAQKGSTKAVSQTEYKVAVQEWEAGRKLPWEKPIPPSEIHDLRYSMTLFATQGCAACHRLKGFESNVGFSIEKEGKIDFASLYRERAWFQGLIPEESLGSHIVKVIEEHAEEIDRRIVDDVRHGSILEEISEKYPEDIESYYSNFRFASRSKNAYYHEMAEKAETEEKKKQALDELKNWVNRVHRLLMMYVQEYGLGRLIGPRPNWSGIYRSDEWLMEHFHNPAAHVPRSIMPVFPFDDTKFYALTYMLDVLGKRNRDEVHAIWQHQGFNPQHAFEIHCSQCHGPYKQGNGPVATWIYPIPKNLNNADFLRNLTKENAAQSIMHGVKGTPMPPWNETPKDKMNYDGIPVLTKEEVGLLVDWLFSSLPGGMVIKGTQDVPKWHYEAEDVIEELEREGYKLKPQARYEKSDSSSLPPKKPSQVGVQENRAHPELQFLAFGEDYYADLEPKVYVNQKNSAIPAKKTNEPQNGVKDGSPGKGSPERGNASLGEKNLAGIAEKSSDDEKVEQIFDVLPNPILGGEKYAYYIKRKYYTKENLEDGRDFFELNCAVCHGADADGTGIRASVMENAKPRMLTNLDWINTRDDLRLLRSIKFGVPGTAMTPWGDLTNALQRMQLVMYIRSLSFEKERRNALAEALYQAFDVSEIQVQRARLNSYPELAELQNKYDQIKKEQRTAAQGSVNDAESIQKAVSLYQKELELKEIIRRRQDLDQLLVQIEKLIDQARDIYQTIGNDMMTASVDDDEWEMFLQIVNLNDRRFVYEDQNLKYLIDHKRDQEIQRKAQQLADAFDKQIAHFEQENEIAQGKFPSSEREALMHSLSAEITSFTKLKSRLLSGIAESTILQNQEEDLLKKFEEQKQALKNTQSDRQNRV